MVDNKEGLPGTVKWENSVPIFKNSLILKQLGLAIGIPFGILTIFLLYGKAYYAVGLIAVLFLLTYLFIRIVWGGNYNVSFVLNKEGIRCFTQVRQAKQNRVVNAMAFVFGLISGKPVVAGAGLLAQSRQDVLIKWKNIRRVKYRPNNCTVMVKGGFTENIALFCTSENYATVTSFIHSKCPNNEKR